MTIIDKTRELGEMISQSEEMKRLKLAEAKQAEDENAKTLMMEFNMNRMNLGRAIENGEMTEEDAVKKNAENFEKMVAGSDVIKEFVEAKSALDKIVNEINSVLNYYITGEDQSCTHNCSTCGGCH